MPYILFFILSIGVCIYVHYFSDVVRDQTSKKKYPLELIVRDKWTCFKKLTNDKYFLKTMSQQEFNYCLLTKLQRIIIGRGI